MTMLEISFSLNAAIVTSLPKRWLIGTHQGHTQHLDYYLGEFAFHFNQRASKSGDKLFYRFIQQNITINPIHGKNLV